VPRRRAKRALTLKEPPGRPTSRPTSPGRPRWLRRPPLRFAGRVEIVEAQQTLGHRSACLQAQLSRAVRRIAEVKSRAGGRWQSARRWWPCRRQSPRRAAAQRVLENLLWSTGLPGAWPAGAWRKESPIQPDLVFELLAGGEGGNALGGDGGFLTSWGSGPERAERSRPRRSRNRGSNLFAFDQPNRFVEMAASTTLETSVLGEFGAGWPNEIARSAFVHRIAKPSGSAGSWAEGKIPLPPCGGAANGNVERANRWGKG